MSTVTLSKPHCAITSAENPDGIASQAFTTTLPDAHVSLTLFAIVFPLRWSIHVVIARSQRLAMTAHYWVALWMLASLTPTSRAVFTIAAQVSSGKGTPFLVRSVRIFASGSPGINTASTPVAGLVFLK